MSSMYSGVMRAIIRGIVCVVVLCALLGCGEGQLMHGYAKTVGTSMEPTLSEGDLVLIIPIKFEDVAVGDVVAFQTMRGMVLHRVIERTEKCLFTRGDGETQDDGFCVSRGDYMGLARL